VLHCTHSARWQLLDHEATIEGNGQSSHEGLVTREEFEKVQRILAARAPDVVCTNTLANDYLLGGLIFCTRSGGTATTRVGRLPLLRQPVDGEARRRGARP
jgi:hypothetical protein